MKPTTGYVYYDKTRKRWVARVSYTDEVTGKRLSIRRWHPLKRDATDALPDLIATLKKHGPRPLKGEQMTVAVMIEAYENDHVKPAEIHNGRKTDGLKSWVSVRHHCAVLKNHLGKKLLRDLRPSDLESYRRIRLRTPTVRGQRKRTVATVNRELETLRAALNYAVREGWLITSPVARTRSLIQKSSETRRCRVLSREEETRLLAACTGPREYLRAILIAALDTGARRGELFKMQWADVDLVNCEITLLVSNTKTEQERRVPVTARLLTELQRLREQTSPAPDDRVFPYADIKRSFASACRVAGVTGFRLHDCRHTTVSRLVAQGVALAEVMRVSGHTTMDAFNRYLNLLSDATKRSADALNDWHGQHSIHPTNEMLN